MVALPFLFMWAFTGASFEFDWPEQAYYASLPGSAPEDQEVAKGAGPMITFEQVIAETQRLHPDAVITGLEEDNLDEPDGSLRVYYQDGYDPYRYSSYPGASRVEIGINGGETVDNAPRADAPIAERLWENDTYEGLHYGTIINGWWRIVWLAFGLTPVLLGITGVTIWLTKRRSRRNRAKRRAAAEA